MFLFTLCSAFVFANCGGGNATSNNNNTSNASSTPCTVGTYSGNVGKGTDLLTINGTNYREGQNGSMTAVPPNGSSVVQFCDPIMETGVGGADIEIIAYFKYDDGSHRKGLHIAIPDTVSGIYDETDIGLLIDYTPSTYGQNCVVNTNLLAADGVGSVTIDSIPSAPSPISGSGSVTTWDTASPVGLQCPLPFNFNFVIAQTL